MHVITTEHFISLDRSFRQLKKIELMVFEPSFIKTKDSLFVRCQINGLISVSTMKATKLPPALLAEPSFSNPELQVYIHLGVVKLRGQVIKVRPSKK